MQRIDKHITLQVQPMFNYHPLSATNEPVMVNMYGFMLNLGVVVSLDMFDE